MLPSGRPTSGRRRVPCCLQAHEWPVAYERPQEKEKKIKGVLVVLLPFSGQVLGRPRPARRRRGLSYAGRRGAAALTGGGRGEPARPSLLVIPGAAGQGAAGRAGPAFPTGPQPSAARRAGAGPLSRPCPPELPLPGEAAPPPTAIHGYPASPRSSGAGCTLRFPRGPGTGCPGRVPGPYSRPRAVQSASSLALATSWSVPQRCRERLNPPCPLLCSVLLLPMVGSLRKTPGTGGLLGYLLLELLFSINDAAVSPYDTRDG